MKKEKEREKKEKKKIVYNSEPLKNNHLNPGWPNNPPYLTSPILPHPSPSPSPAPNNQTNPAHSNHTGLPTTAHHAIPA